MRTLLTFFLSLFITVTSAQIKLTDTINVFSNAMHKTIKCVIIKPNNYNKNAERYAVVYLLHGYSGSYNNWVKKMPALQKDASFYNMIIVCPDGKYNSWYVDSPIDSTVKYESFIASELVNFIDKHYRTQADKGHRGITGLSMGGHGALMLAMRHQQVFGAAASMSGAVDLTEVIGKYDTDKMLGDTASNAMGWKKYSVLKIVDTLTNKKMPLLIDCGIKDIFIKGNRALHEKLMLLQIPHDYVERNGEHNWQYWTNALPYHLLFFKKYFESTKL